MKVLSVLLLLHALLRAAGALPVYNVKDYGAKGDGVTLDTLAIKSALLDAKSGGTVLFPSPGNYLTGPFNVTGSIELRIDENAMITFSSDRSLHPFVIDPTTGVLRMQPLIWGIRAPGLSFSGKGKLF